MKPAPFPFALSLSKGKNGHSSSRVVRQAHHERLKNAPPPSPFALSLSKGRLFVSRRP
jgi:hypothetical protein